LSNHLSDADPPRILVLAGPTGVGKTALSLWLAEQLDAEIVGIDSVQIYKRLDIGSAKPTLEERAQAPHHLFDVLEPDVEHNAGDYCERADAAIQEIHQRGKRVILVGGTGLYIRTLVHGLLEAPPPDWELRARLDAEAAQHGAPALHARLAEVDPELAARLHPNDLIRVSRGLEIFEQTGQRLSALQAAHRFATPRYHAHKIALTRPREDLFARIEQRVGLMMAQGWLDEVRGLIADYPRSTKVLQTLGYRQLVDHLLDGVPLDLTQQEIIRQTKRYARQQETWLRTERDVIWHDATTLDDPPTRAALLAAVRAHFLAAEG
jgi:tRNA dimethylallyltransferase